VTSPGQPDLEMASDIAKVVIERRLANDPVRPVKTIEQSLERAVDPGRLPIGPSDAVG
jgi:hypothetical protein